MHPDDHAERRVPRSGFGLAALVLATMGFYSVARTRRWQSLSCNKNGLDRKRPSAWFTRRRLLALAGDAPGFQVMAGPNLASAVIGLFPYSNPKQHVPT
jgi:hypothetical protein